MTYLTQSSLKTRSSVSRESVEIRLTVSKVHACFLTKYLACILFCLILVLLTTKPVSAQDIPIKSIPLPMGSGARALGQGGAFIAVADDATAASWNPAGLIQLEKSELSIVGSYLITDQNFSVRGDTLDFPFKNTSKDTLDNEDVGRWDVNFLSLVYPFNFLGKNFVSAINYHQTMDFHTDINFTDFVNDRKVPRLVSRQIDFKSSGGVGALSPSIGFLLRPNLSFGLTVNVFDDEFFNSHAWTETLLVSSELLSSGLLEHQNFKRKVSSRDYHGANVNLGIMWDIWEKDSKKFTLGAVFHSAYTARFDREMKVWSRGSSRLKGVADFSPDEEKSRIKIDWPMFAGLGFGLRLSDALSFSFDIVWEDWSEWTQKTKDDRGIALKDTRPIGNGSKHDNIDDTISARFGAEYLSFRENSILAFRGGLFFEQRPSIGASSFNVNDKPKNPDGDPIDVLGFSLGIGITTKRYSIDAAYQFRYIRDMEGSNIGLPDSEIDANESLFLTSLIIYL